ncbi:hypothetical protein H7H82_23685 [Mycobacterium heidelbergense]|uniref:Uncharacterized protein n=1 Tax=Mycobacterium heidelbergense TaxID=53376 RepID=A0A1X0D7X2_MYCHE|nr:hypothetical protein [Mycobacterium heidelbergense]MCV7053560.1 hypothetical protein [Mycobacterium heidelbergense]ORA68504.1 hypothetical protein BST25_22110 [Mycobacterium heidelbergense]BBZ51696.1 hypothetical protein MHEI_34130 [Mycobacterium heidelbergense]
MIPVAMIGANVVNPPRSAMLYTSTSDAAGVKERGNGAGSASEAMRIPEIAVGKSRSGCQPPLLASEASSFFAPAKQIADMPTCESWWSR